MDSKCNAVATALLAMAMLLGVIRVSHAAERVVNPVASSPTLAPIEAANNTPAATPPVAGQSVAPANATQEAIWGIYARLIGSTLMTGKNGPPTSWHWREGDEIIQTVNGFADRKIRRGAAVGELVALDGRNFKREWKGTVAADGSVVFVDPKDTHWLLKYSSMRISLSGDGVLVEEVKIKDGHVVSASPWLRYFGQIGGADHAGQAADSKPAPATTAVVASTGTSAPAVARSGEVVAERATQPGVGEAAPMPMQPAAAVPVAAVTSSGKKTPTTQGNAATSEPAPSLASGEVSPSQPRPESFLLDEHAWGVYGQLLGKSAGGQRWRVSPSGTAIIVEPNLNMSEARGIALIKLIGSQLAMVRYIHPDVDIDPTSGFRSPLMGTVQADGSVVWEALNMEGRVERIASDGGILMQKAWNEMNGESPGWPWQQQLQVAAEPDGVTRAVVDAKALEMERTLPEVVGAAAQKVQAINSRIAAKRAKSQRTENFQRALYGALTQANEVATRQQEQSRAQLDATLDQIAAQAEAQRRAQERQAAELQQRQAAEAASRQLAASPAAGKTAGGSLTVESVAASQAVASAPSAPKAPPSASRQAPSRTAHVSCMIRDLVEKKTYYSLIENLEFPLDRVARQNAANFTAFVVANHGARADLYYPTCDYSFNDRSALERQQSTTKAIDGRTGFVTVQTSWTPQPVD